MSEKEGFNPQEVPLNQQDFAVQSENKSMEGQRSRIIKEKLGLTGSSEPLPEDFAEQKNYNDVATIGAEKIKKMIKEIRDALFSK
jgi:hypothetical protein